MTVSQRYRGSTSWLDLVMGIVWVPKPHLEVCKKIRTTVRNIPEASRSRTKLWRSLPLMMYWNFAVMCYQYYTRHVLSLRSTKSDPISQVNGRLRKNVSCKQRMPIYTVYLSCVHVCIRAGSPHNAFACTSIFMTCDLIYLWHGQGKWGDSWWEFLWLQLLLFQTKKVIYVCYTSTHTLAASL